jgi:hypothetical protein
VTGLLSIAGALVLTALLMGTSFGHVLQMGPKLRVDGPQWLSYQHTLYRRFASVGGTIEAAAVLAATLEAWLLRDSGPAFVLVFFAALLLSIAFFGVWLCFTNAVNRRTARWSSTTLPPDWQRWRRRWEYSHAVRFGLQFAGFLALLSALLAFALV